MTGAMLVVSDPVQLHHHDLLTTELAEDRLQQSTELSADIGRHEAQQSVSGLAHDVNSEATVIIGRLQLYDGQPTRNLPQSQATS